MYIQQFENQKKHTKLQLPPTYVFFDLPTTHDEKHYSIQKSQEKHINIYKVATKKDKKHYITATTQKIWYNTEKKTVQKTNNFIDTLARYSNWMCILCAVSKKQQQQKS